MSESLPSFPAETSIPGPLGSCTTKAGRPDALPSQVTGLTPNKLISDLLGADRDPRAAIVGSCIRDICLRIGLVSAITGLSVPTIYREIGHDRFPRPIKITAGARAWRLSEIMDWIDTRERDVAGGRS
jgi:predicted DNA-binding transcriptional regulator AlpA